MGSPQWHVEPDPVFAEAQLRGLLYSGVTAWGMNLHAEAICVQSSLPCVVLKDPGKQAMSRGHGDVAGAG
jgi:hypothetical protein